MYSSGTYRFIPWSLVLLLTLLAATPSTASLFRRTSLENLVDEHEIILVGEVLDLHSYWNGDGTFILTDVTVQPEEFFKGSTGSGPVTFTLQGGTVDELTTVIVGGPRLAQGESYLLFLNEQSLSPTLRTLTIREHSQGVFEFSVSPEGELRMLSQANGMKLVPDSKGRTAPAGGFDGMIPEEIFQAIVSLVSERGNS